MPESCHTDKDDKDVMIAPALIPWGLLQYDLNLQ